MAYGNPYVNLPMRSTAKPFIIQPLLNNHGVEKFSLTPREIAVMVSSHNGELIHRETVLGILNKIGLSETALGCGTHPPYFDWIIDQTHLSTHGSNHITPLYNNCSGKHSGMLMLCHLMGFPKADYWKATHPVQQLILGSIASTLKCAPGRVRLGIDGCGVPTYVASLYAIADAYQQLLINKDLRIVKDAMLQEPYMIAGKERLEYDILASCSYLAKSGADGIFCLSIPDDNIGIAIKIESGSDSAAESVAVEILDKMGLVSSDQSKILDKYRYQSVLTNSGLAVGKYEPVF